MSFLITILFTYICIVIGYLLIAVIVALAKTFKLAHKKVKLVKIWRSHLVKCFDNYKKSLLTCLHKWEDFMNYNPNVIVPSDNILFKSIAETTTNAFKEAVDKYKNIEITDITSTLLEINDINDLTKKFLKNEIVNMTSGLIILQEGLKEISEHPYPHIIFSKELNDRATKETQKRLF